MKESAIRSIFTAISWPPKAIAFQKLITFIIESVNVKTDKSEFNELKEKVTQLESNLSTKADSSELASIKSSLASKADASALTELTGRVEALESAQQS